MNPNYKPLNLYSEASLDKRIGTSRSGQPGRTHPTESHKYSVGQTLHLSPLPFGAGTKQNVFRVVKLLPADNGDYQYRLKSVEDGHERVARESLLNLVKGIGSGSI